MLVPEVARYRATLDDFLLLPRSAEEAPLVHFRFLDRRLDLPLHPQWRDWLWERALRTAEASPLEAEGILAFRCAPHPEALADELSMAIRAGTLQAPEPTREVGGGASR